VVSSPNSFSYAGIISGAEVGLQSYGGDVGVGFGINYGTLVTVPAAPVLVHMDIVC